MVRAIFLGLCVFGVLALVLGLVFEFTRSRSDTRLITKRQLRWRIISAILWIFIFGSLAYATAFLWPEGAPRTVQQRFLIVISGAVLLMIPAFLVVLLDLRFTLAAQKMRQRQFEKSLEEMAREEMEKRKSKGEDKKIAE